MKLFRRWHVCCVYLLLLSILLTWQVEADILGIELNVNNEDVELKFDSPVKVPKAELHFGYGGIYSESDYWLVHGLFSLQDSLFHPGLKLGLGIKGVYGQRDTSIGEFDLAAAGFHLLTEFDVRKVKPNVPLSFAMGLTMAPSPLSFSDTDRYVDFYLASYVYIIKNAGLVFGYRKFDVRIVDDPIETKMNSDAFYFGCKLIF